MTTSLASATGSIHSIESFGTVDGPGIRFIVFFQGCVMRCLYCHNPDTWDIKAGRLITIDELMQEIISYKHFLIPNGGGVTASGGEAMLQAEFISQWFKACHSAGISTCLDTNGYVKRYTQHIIDLLQETDLVMLDLKQINNDTHKKLTGISNQYTLNFARYLQQQNKPTWIRYVVVPGWTDDDNSAHLLGQFTQSMQNIEKIELLPFHKLGEHKWQNLGWKYKLESTQPPSSETLKRIQHIIASYGHKVTY
ncbi:pyruvate formate lyase 1-activating protein [Entomomonas sp. E2T0]|uniref:pyruvate formate lyase 1-activating protein n=1 Tax=Entomomonas sp. E2T0 TaxID=2930213 RepID=UPI00222837C7|nr:pyruvate formate lyase 1-activating protein [Entomomonas sp. E2T0]UYZ82712.1 pyruvate formate lyase 1-activating protein [Entomomonas sp. E2T0]